MKITTDGLKSWLELNNYKYEETGQTIIIQNDKDNQIGKFCVFINVRQRFGGYWLDGGRELGEVHISYNLDVDDAENYIDELVPQFLSELYLKLYKRELEINQ